MTVTPGDLRYPVLCLSERAGIAVIRDAAAFGRSAAPLVWGARFYDGLRVVDASGALHEVVRAEVVRPGSAAGQAVARLFGTAVHVGVELRPVGPAALAELRARVLAEIDDDPEAVEEMTGRPPPWWREALERAADAGALVRATAAGAPGG
jgi:hypothetical protein